MTPPPVARRALLTTALIAAPPIASRRALAQPRPLVAASFSILGDLASQLAGDRIGLRVLVGPETDAHEFQPRPSDAEALRGAALVIRNGLGFEPWLDRMLRSAGTPADRIVTATDGVTPRLVGGAPDPHAWQDVRLAQSYVRRIADRLPFADPAGLLGRLVALDAEIRDALATIPPERRVFVTSHGAFGYFAAAYGVRVLAPQGSTPGAQPSAAQLAGLIRQIRAERITAIFTEGPGNAAVMQRLVQETGTALRGRLYADTLSTPDGPAPTYEAMMRHNLSLMLPAMRGA